MFEVVVDVCDVVKVFGYECICFEGGSFGLYWVMVVLCYYFGLVECVVLYGMEGFDYMYDLVSGFLVLFECLVFVVESLEWLCEYILEGGLIVGFERMFDEVCKGLVMVIVEYLEIGELIEMCFVFM